MGRDRGRGKRGGRTGGRRSYIANIEELQKREAGAADDSNEDDSEEDEDDEEETVGEKSTGAADSVFDFRARRAAAAAEEEDEEESKPRGLLAGVERKANPNLVKKHDKMLKVSSLSADDGIPADPEAGMNRKEREAMEAIRKKEEYMKKHLAGETEQARKDLERLALVRKKRAEDAAKREAEGRKPGMSAHGLEDGQESSSDDDDDGPKAKAPAISESAAKKKAAAAEVVSPASESGKLEALKAIDIKKMNGDALKEHLKQRGLGLQGAKKDLMQRLIDFEKAREASV